MLGRLRGSQFKTLLRNSQQSLRFLKKLQNENKKKESFAKTIVRLTNTQVNLYIAERLRRLIHIYSLYRQIYQEYANSVILRRFLRKFKDLPRFHKVCYALSATAFSWHDNGIEDKEMLKQVKEWDLLKTRLFIENDEDPFSLLTEKHDDGIPNAWSNVIDDPTVKAWTAPYKDTGYLEYKVYGRFHDISASTYFQVQVDTEYRKQWDKHVIKLDVIDSNDKTNAEVIQWVSKFPYPLKPREYVCMRRTKIDEKNKLMFICNRIVSHPDCPPCSEYVRVVRYESHMIIKPHLNFDEPGFDYYLVYQDDPQMMISPGKLSWVLAKGLCDYVKELYEAAKSLENSTTVKKIHMSTHVQKQYFGNDDAQNFKRLL